MKTKLQILVLLFLTSFIAMAQTGPGEIDNSFNFSGIGAYGGVLPGNAAFPQSGVDGNVYKSKVYPATSPNKDKILIVGRFTSYNGVARERMARLNPDGTLDTTWIGPNFIGGNDYLYCVEILKDDKILIGGGFSLPGNVKNFARLNEDGSLDLTFNPVASGLRGASGPVHAVTAQYNGANAVQKIYIGGDFTTYNTITNRRLHRLNADGSPDATYNPSGTLNAEIRSIAIQKKSPNINKVVVGGFFTAYTVGGVTQGSGRLLRFDTSGEIDNTFNNGNATAAGGTCVFDIALLPTDEIYAVGSFTTYSGAQRQGVVKTNNNGLLTWNNIGVKAGQTVFCVQIQPDAKILLGGTMNTWNGTTSALPATNFQTVPKGIIRLNKNGTLDNTFLTGLGFQGGTDVYLGTSVIRDIQQQSDTKIITGGDFTTYDGTARRMIARIKTRECAVAAVWNGAALGWSDGIEPTGDTYYMAIVSGTYTVPTGTHMTVCELEVKAGATLVIQSDASLTVKGVVMNNGTFKMENSGSLVQIKEDPNADQGAGVFTMKRETTPVNRFDFTYWSSPVEEQLLYDFSPNTLSDKYFSWDTNAGWQPIYNGAALMVPGKGYIIRAPQTSSIVAAEAAPITLTFSGRVNNGLVTAPIVKNGVKTWNLVGNPYPSAIDAIAFLSNTDNQAVIGGTIYLWTHKTAISPAGQVYQYNSNDYMVYNKTGTTVVKPNGVDFNGYIAAGQGFFVEGIANGAAKFVNTMRVSGDDKNKQFMRVAQNQNTQNDVRDNSASDNNRFWLNLTNENGAFKQTLVGFINGATNGIDRSYDGAALNGNSYVNLYSIAEGKNLVIQGRAMPFTAEQIIPLGFSTTVAGTFNISLAKFDGLFEGQQDIYLLDKLTNTTQQLKGASYTFTTAAGTFDNRFEIHFADGLDAMKGNVVTANDVIAVKQGKEISIKSTMIIKEASVYDVAGKLLYHNTNVDSLEMITNNLNMQTGVAIVRMTLENNQQITKKILVD